MTAGLSDRVVLLPDLKKRKKNSGLEGLLHQYVSSARVGNHDHYPLFFSAATTHILLMTRCSTPKRVEAISKKNLVFNANGNNTRCQEGHSKNVSLIDHKRKRTCLPLSHCSLIS